MSLPDDLTRWNRSGLERFHYVDGNAASYLEILRERLAERFPHWQALVSYDLTTADEANQLALLQAQYHREHGDWGWELARTLARSCHVLAGYIDAYTNEGYLGTATQWDNLRRLVEFIDYHPAPPASATAHLVLETKPGNSGDVNEGFQVKYTPADGSDPVLFETLQDLSIAPVLNEIRLENWNRSPIALGANALSATWITADGGAIAELELSPGQYAVLMNGRQTEEAVAVRINDVDVASGLITLADPVPSQYGLAQWTKGDSRMLTAPKTVHQLHLNGPSVIHFQRAHDFSVNDVVAWLVNDVWYFARVTEAGQKAVELSSNNPPPVQGQQVYPAYSITRPFLDTFNFSADIQTVVYWNGAAYQTLSKGKEDTASDYYEKISPDRTYNVVQNSSINEIFIVSTAANRIAIVDTSPPGQYRLIGKGVGLAPGMWVVGESDHDHRPLKIFSITEQDEGNVLTLQDNTLADYNAALRRIYGPFKHTIYPQSYQDNPTRQSSNRFTPDAKNAPEILAALRPGRKVLIEQQQQDSYANALIATVLDSNVAEGTFDISMALNQTQGFTTGNTIIRGNVVLAGHGERNQEKTLGSGEATQVNQSFILKVDDVTFVEDAAQTSGVRAAIDVKVDGQIWTQVSNLSRSSPTDAHYTVRMTAEGFLKILFGDGVNGRRLPSGKNNLRIAYRVGSGLSGNVAAGGLEKPARPHPLVEAVRQPITATGGNDMEGKHSLRQSAPATLLTLNRAVSLADFSGLATRHSSVWQAKAFRRSSGSGRFEKIEVVVVAADGVELTMPLQRRLEDHLQTHALPSVRVEVSAFERLLLVLEVHLRIDTHAFDPEVVMKKVTARLQEQFSLERRGIGQPVYLSELFMTVEEVTGVTNSTLILNVSKTEQAAHIARGPDGEVRAIMPGERQVLFLDKPAPALTLTYETFSL